MPSAIAAPLAKAAVGVGVSKLMGGGKSSGGGGGGGSPILGFRSPGIRADLRPGENRFDVSSTGTRKTLIEQLRENLGQSADLTREYIPRFTGAFGEAISGTRDLLGRVAPGISELREARLQGLMDAKERTMSNLTQNLARRRVAGSSFANEQAAQARAEFARMEDEIRGTSFLQEIEMTNQFQNQLLEQEVGQIDMEFQNYMAALQLDKASTQVELDEQNKLADLGAQLASGAQSAASSLRSTELELDAKSRAGAGAFAERIVGDIDFGKIFDRGGTTTPTPPPLPPFRL